MIFRYGMADDGKVPRTVNLFRVFRGGGCYPRDEPIFPVVGCYPRDELIFPVAGCYTEGI